MQNSPIDVTSCCLTGALGHWLREVIYIRFHLFIIVGLIQSITSTAL